MNRTGVDIPWRPTAMFAGVLAFPPAKINLGLHVLGKRADGYHAIETVMLPIALHDALEITVNEAAPRGAVVMQRSGLPVPGDPQEDLCVKAALAFGAGRDLPGLSIHVLKGIPIGAGLGGGSSDAAHTLLALNAHFGAPLDRAALSELAARIGSDCPFFIQPGAQLATGRGEVLAPLSLNLRSYWLMLINPGIHVSTREVYANTPHAPAACDLAHVVSSEPPENWNERVVNVMEAYVLKAYPAVAEAKRRIEEAGPVYAAMSGSGSSVFGIFREQPSPPALPRGQRAWVMLIGVDART